MNNHMTQEQFKRQMQKRAGIRELLTENSFDAGCGGTAGTVAYGPTYGTQNSAFNNPDKFVNSKSIGNHSNTRLSVTDEDTDDSEFDADEIHAGLEFELGQQIKKDLYLAKQTVISNLQSDPTYYSDLKQLDIDDDELNEIAFNDPSRNPPKKKIAVEPNSKDTSFNPDIKKQTEIPDDKMIEPGDLDDNGNPINPSEATIMGTPSQNSKFMVPGKRWTARIYKNPKLNEAEEPSEEEKAELLKKLFARAGTGAKPAGSTVQHPDDKTYYKLPAYQDRIRAGDDEESRPIRHPKPKTPIKPKEPDIPLESVEGPELVPHDKDETEKMSKQLQEPESPEGVERQRKAKEAAAAYLAKLKQKKDLKETSTFAGPKANLSEITSIMQSMRQEKRDRHV
jgi:hypothetical protein